MSVHISSFAWKNTVLKGNARLLLLALADMANDEGVCWPSIETLRQRLNVETDRAVQKLLKELEAEGLLTRKMRSGHSTVYELSVADPRTVGRGEQWDGVNSGTPYPRTVGRGRGEQWDGGGVNSGTPRTVIEPSKEPSKEPSVSFVAQGAPTQTEVPTPEKPKATSEARGTRLSETWTPSPELIAWAREKCPGVDLLLATDKFCDYWRAKPGAAGRKTDWNGTWRNWIRTEFQHTTSRTRYSPLPQQPSKRERFEAAKAMRGQRLAQELHDLGLTQ